MNVFSEDHNIRYSIKQLEYLEKSSSLFLLNFFIDVYYNLSKSKAISLKFKLYELPTLKAKVDIKILPIVQNTAYLPQEDRYCDLEGYVDSSEVGCILICDHDYHFECFLFKLESQCRYCADYLISEIENNCKAFQKTLDSFDKIVIDENINELDITGPSDDTNIGIKDFSLDDRYRQKILMKYK